MGTYASPFGSTSSSGTSKSTNYISPFKDSQYTQEYWDKTNQDNAARQQKTTAAKQVADNLARGDAAVKQSQADVWSPGKIFGDIYKAVGGVANATSKLVVNTIKEGINQAQNIGKQTAISAGAKGTNPDLIALKDSETRYLQGELKKPNAPVAEINQRLSKLNAGADKAQAAISKGEKEQGVKYNPSSAVTDAILLGSNFVGLGGVAKTVFTKAAEGLAKKLGRDLTEQEAKTLAEKTKAVIPQEAAQGLKIANPDNAVISSGTKPVETTVPDTVLHIPGKDGQPGVFSRVTPEQAQHLKNETENIPFDATDRPHLTAGDKVLTTAQEVPIEKIREMSPNAAKALDSVPETVKPVGDTVSGNSSRIEAVALEKKLTDKMGDLPQYKSINMKDQADKAINLVTNDRQKAIDIIEGKSNPPDGLHAQSVHQALEDVAVKEGNGQLLTQLAKSHINTELSEGAQKLRIAAERDPHSAVEAIRQVQDARAKASRARVKSSEAKVKSDIKTQVAKATPKPTKETWASFVEGLVC